MQWIEKIVLVLKIVFILSAFIKIFSTHNTIRINLSTELQIARMFYYNASLLLFMYLFNPFSGKICLEGEEKLLVFSFAVIEVIEEFLDRFYPNLL